MNSLKTQNKCIKIFNIFSLNLNLTLDCGQTFRWEKNENGNWCSVVHGKYIELSQNLNEGSITFYNSSKKEIDKYWNHYFDLDRNYNEICSILSADKNINRAITEFPGIHILNQDPWEILCSFIISQNNNIPRIKGIIERLCENFGDFVIEKNDKKYYSFPSAKKLATLSIEDLAPLRSGFRAKYIIDAATKVASGEINLTSLKNLSLEEAETELMKIKGVGKKVAHCVLLYSCEQIDAFPKDVWVKRIMKEIYPNGLHPCTKGIRGIAQQYLFHWRRNSVDFK
ncbi:MAG: DNA-3-methyladenine glycosylase 2 [Ruminococcaceae bacterium]|nr:DNA-3-methyladenine glycosylase 2 [Oscillospiraceae bacterium]